MDNFIFSAHSQTNISTNTTRKMNSHFSDYCPFDCQTEKQEQEKSAVEKYSERWSNYDFWKWNDAKMNDGIENMRVMMRTHLIVTSAPIPRSAGFLTGQWWRRHFKLITCHLLGKQTECDASRHTHIRCSVLCFLLRTVFCVCMRVSLLWRKNICSSRRCLTSKYYSSSFQLNKYPD